MCADGQISPLHYWGCQPERNDILLGHRQNRFEIVFRHRFCQGTDPYVLFQTLWCLARGATGVYSASQPDIIRAIPFLRRLFPKKTFSTWIWTAHEAHANANYVKHCNHVYALTNQGHEELQKQGLADRSSLGIWGCDPKFYALQPSARPRIENDLLFFGLTSRDIKSVRELAAAKRFRITAPQLCISKIGDNLGLREAKADSKSDLLRTIYSAHVSLVPLMGTDQEPTGYTNVIESLFCGTSVVIPVNSVIPKCVLDLPGVHRYQAENLESLLIACQEAVTDNRRPERRTEISSQAAKLLNGKALAESVNKVMGRQPHLGNTKRNIGSRS